MNIILRSSKGYFHPVIVFKRCLHQPTLPTVPSSTSTSSPTPTISQPLLSLSSTHPDFTDSKTLLHKRITNLLLSNKLEAAFDLLEAYSLHPNPQIDNLTLLLVAQNCLKNTGRKNGNTLKLDCYDKILKLIEYSKTFKLNCQPTLHSYLLKAYLKLPVHLQPQDPSSHEPEDLESCHFLLRRMITQGQYREASRLFRKLRLGQLEFAANATSFSIMIHMSVIQQEWIYALKWLHQMKRYHITPTAVIYHQIILLLARCREDEQALMHLEEMKQEYDLIPLKQTYQALILHFTGYDPEHTIIPQLKQEFLLRYTIPTKQYYTQLVRSHLKQEDYQSLNQTISGLYEHYPNEHHFFVIKMILSHLIQFNKINEAKAIFNDAVNKGFVVPEYLGSSINELVKV